MRRSKADIKFKNTKKEVAEILKKFLDRIVENNEASLNITISRDVKEFPSVDGYMMEKAPGDYSFLIVEMGPRIRSLE